MARASALHAEGQRFDSVILHPKEHNDMMEAKDPVANGILARKTRNKRVEQTSVSAHETKQRRDMRQVVFRRRQKDSSAELSGKDKTEHMKGAWGMPRLSEAKKDVTSCEKPERGANAR